MRTLIRLVAWLAALPTLAFVGMVFHYMSIPTIGAGIAAVVSGLIASGCAAFGALASCLGTQGTDATRLPAVLSVASAALALLMAVVNFGTFAIFLAFVLASVAAYGWQMSAMVMGRER
ncbi:MAG: hypothetical protein H6738_01645 [Alphaproteobacteria bacterium]|nr:hypothetical protein [Alphaproteobacteria bacterium]MCB9695471.1 hypothetical protein [Alphaproteobacteria bacterium]